MRLKDLAELLRLPAALTVPGDALVGGAAGLTPAAPSLCLYWAGMALNDYADRELDAVERPERPIPSGRIRPGEALAVAVGLTGAGLALAARRPGGLRVAVPLALAVWAYDLKLKNTSAGPAAMAAARGLDVLLGGGRGAARAAAAIAVHTYGVTVLSRGEVSGSSRAQAATALAATAAAAALAALPRPGRTATQAARAAAVAIYTGSVGYAQYRAALRRDSATTRSAVGAGILGLIPLQAALAAGRAGPADVAVLAASYPLAVVLARRVSPT